MPSTSLPYEPVENDSQFLKKILLFLPAHVLFDCDGLLLDTEPIYTHVALQAIRHFLAQAGLRIEDDDPLKLFPPELKNKVMGGSRQEVATKMVDHLNSAYPQLRLTPQDWIDQTLHLENHQFSLGCPLMPQAFQAVDLFVNQLKWPAALATSSARHCFAIKSASHANLFDSFHHITCGDDPDLSSTYNSIVQVVKGKPDPSIFKTARLLLNRTPLQPGIVLEDSPNGVVAALRSGHSCIWVPSTGETAKISFALIDEILCKFNDLPRNDLWVYKASSLKEVINSLTL